MVPLDDDEEEDEEEEEEDEEEEYLDEGSDEEEGWGADAMADALDMADAGLQPGSWGGLHPLLDGMPGGGAGGASFGRMPGRRVMLRQGTASAAAGVWDDADADVDTVEGTLGGALQNSWARAVALVPLAKGLLSTGHAVCCCLFS
jgi:hypothetical protein